MRVRGIFAPTTTRFLSPIAANDLQNVENQARIEEQGAHQEELKTKPNQTVPADSIVAPQDAYVGEEKISYRSYQNLMNGKFAA